MLESMHMHLPVALVEKGVDTSSSRSPKKLLAER
jgi:hypothetical protein